LDCPIHGAVVTNSGGARVLDQGGQFFISRVPNFIMGRLYRALLAAPIGAARGSIPMGRLCRQKRPIQ